MNDNRTDNFDMLASNISNGSTSGNLERTEPRASICTPILSTNQESVVKGFNPESPEVKQALEQFDPKLAYINSDGKVYPTYELSPDYQQELLNTRHDYNNIEIKRR